MEQYLDSLNIDELVTLINPTAKDFSCKVDDRTGHLIDYYIKSRESLELPRYAAEHVADRLADKMLSNHSGVLTQALRESTLRQIKMYE